MEGKSDASRHFCLPFGLGAMYSYHIIVLERKTLEVVIDSDLILP